MFTFEIAFVSHDGQRNPIDTLLARTHLSSAYIGFSLAIINGWGRNRERGGGGGVKGDRSRGLVTR